LPEFVGFTKGEHDVFELDHRAFRRVIHELERTLVVGLSKAMLVREPVKRDTIRLCPPGSASDACLPVERVAIETTDQISVR
jgi:hypothetical protein